MFGWLLKIDFDVGIRYWYMQGLVGVGLGWFFGFVLLGSGFDLSFVCVGFWGGVFALCCFGFV